MMFVTWISVTAEMLGLSDEDRSFEWVVTCQIDKIWAVTCDFQQYGILTSVDSDESVQAPFKLITPNDI